jgi:hypothetical protein
MKPKPAPLDIATRPPNDGTATPFWLMGCTTPADAERLALLMSHSPELLNELRACYETLLRVLDHQRDGKPLPPQFETRRTAQDAWNVLGLATGAITEGTWRYPG